MINKILKSHQEIVQMLMDDEELNATIEHITESIVECFRHDNKVLFCGNGGSAADAQHLAAELSGRFYLDRPPLPAEALHTNSSYITAVANDFSFDDIYSRYVKGVGKKGDVILGFSTSGNSKNVVKAFESANEIELITVGFTGEDGGELAELSDFLINIPSNDTPRIQEAHIIIGHIICEIVEKELFGNEDYM